MLVSKLSQRLRSIFVHYPQFQILHISLLVLVFTLVFSIHILGYYTTDQHVIEFCTKHSSIQYISGFNVLSLFYSLHILYAQYIQCNDLILYFMLYHLMIQVRSLSSSFAVSTWSTTSTATSDESLLVEDKSFLLLFFRTFNFSVLELVRGLSQQLISFQASQIQSDIIQFNSILVFSQPFIFVLEYFRYHI